MFTINFGVCLADLQKSKITNLFYIAGVRLFRGWRRWKSFFLQTVKQFLNFQGANRLKYPETQCSKLF